MTPHVALVPNARAVTLPEGYISPIGVHQSQHLIGKPKVFMTLPGLPGVRHGELPGGAPSLRSASVRKPFRAALEVKGSEVMRSQRTVSPAAVSGGAEDFFSARKELSEEQGRREGSGDEVAEKQRQLFARDARIDAAQLQIEAEIRQRGEKLREAALIRKLDSELKFGKLLFSQEKYAAALAHFEKVLNQTQTPLSNQAGDATYWKGQCLERLGRKSEAKDAYESLLFFRAPFSPHLRRRAAQAVELLRTGGGSSSSVKVAKAGGTADMSHPGAAVSTSLQLDEDFEIDVSSSVPRGVIGGGKGRAEERPSGISEYMYRLYSATKDGYASYYPSQEEKYSETKEERALVNLVTASMLLMGPIFIGVMMWANTGGGTH